MMTPTSDENGGGVLLRVPGRLAAVHLYQRDIAVVGRFRKSELQIAGRPVNALLNFRLRL
jgi:hypothetical protein